MKEREALKYLLAVVETAIKQGDWKVDGACDPDLEIRVAHEVLRQPQPFKVSPMEFISIVLNKEDISGRPLIWAEWPRKEEK